MESRPDLLATVVAVEALAYESSAAGVSLALHAGVTAGLDGNRRFADLDSGEVVGAIALSSDDVPVEQDGRLSGRAAWVTPRAPRGVVSALGRWSACCGGLAQCSRRHAGASGYRGAWRGRVWPRPSRRRAIR